MRDTVNLTTDSGIDLRLGSDLYQIRLAFHGPRHWLIRVPLVGKAWAYGVGGSGRTTWAGVQEEHLQGLSD